MLTGTSSVARAWSENFDAIIGGRFKEFSLTYLKMETPGFAEYPDFFAFTVIIILTSKKHWANKLFYCIKTLSFSYPLLWRKGICNI